MRSTKALRWISLAISISVGAAVGGCGSDEGEDGKKSGTKYSVTISETAGLNLSEHGDDKKKQDGEDEEDGGHQKACSDYFGTDAKVTTVSGNKSEVRLDPEDVMAIKISGNQNSASVTIEADESDDAEESDDSDSDSESDGESSEEGEDEPGFTGLCFILSGNQSSATITLENFNLGKFGYVGRGNEPSVTLNVGEEAGVDGFMVDLAGNQSSLSISGSGSYTCPDGELSGNSTTIDCEEPDSSSSSQ